jgi:hypothetical protein
MVVMMSSDFYRRIQKAPKRTDIYHGHEYRHLHSISLVGANARAAFARAAPHLPVDA